MGFLLWGIRRLWNEPRGSRRELYRRRLRLAPQVIPFPRVDARIAGVDKSQ